MDISYINIITLLYSIGGVVTFIGFFPTIRDLYNGKPSANMSTYIVWTITAFIATLYAATVLHDMTFTLVIGLQLVAQVTILYLRFRLSFKK
jgi:hypothetical protein